MTSGFTFAGGEHDRHSERRDLESLIPTLLADPTTRVLEVGGEHVGVVGTEDPTLRWRSPAESPRGEVIYLGTLDGLEHVAVMVDRVASPATALRLIAADLDPAQARMAVHAVGIAQWHRTHPRCARCGEPTDAAQGGHVRHCPVCGADHFPRSDPAVIMLITDEDDRALLGRRPTWPDGRFSTLAGFVEPGETLEDAVRRETHEETAVTVGDVWYASSQPWPFPSSLMLGFYGRALSTDITVDGTETADARWFTRDEVTEMTAAGALSLPGIVSISRWLIEGWHGGHVEGAWR